MVLEVVGYIAGLLVALALAPQLIKIWRTKSAKDLSFVWTTSFLIGLILYIIYAGMNQVWPLFVFTIIEALMVITLIILKIKYDGAESSSAR
jgi:MtN3 and saliva related transmembrane protein